MADDEQKEVTDVLAGIPALATYRGAITRLGGLTNRVYQAGPIVVRLPGKGTEEYINRGHEMVMAREAAAAGVSPDLVHADPQSGVLITAYIEGAQTMTPALFKSVPGAPGRAGEAFAKLHQSGRTFPFRFELFAMIDDYLKILATKTVNLPAGYHDAVREAESVRRVLAAKPVPLAPCHCDPLCENFLDTGSRMWIVDWEYAGMNDPMWDLGDLSVEGSFDPQQDDDMLAAYFNGAVPGAQRGRMIIYKAMCDLLWTLWGLIQHANGNPADDFNTYALRRFARCKELMASATFRAALAEIG